MGLESASASEDVIVDLPSPWATIKSKYWWQSRTKGEEKVGTHAESVISMYLSGLKKDYGGKRCVFNEERKKGKVGQDRTRRGREFQMDEAANEKERRPFADQGL